jgi:hypothetical protein
MSRRNKACLLLAASFALAACGGPAKQQSGHKVSPTAAQGTPDVVVDPVALKEAIDPCAEQLHDICGAMLLYYLAAHRLPNNLRELGAFADQPLVFTCPLSGDDYEYRPISLQGTVDHPQLVMYDRHPVHQGRRWGIVGAPAEGKRPVSLWVVPFDDVQMQEYLRPVISTGIQQPVNVPPATQPTAP